MAKKKSPQKKHKFKHVEPSVTSVESIAQSDAPVRAPGQIVASVRASTPVAHTVSAGSAYGYVGPDMRRTMVLSGILIALELALFYVMVYTPVGKAIYALVKV